MQYPISAILLISIYIHMYCTYIFPYKKLFNTVQILFTNKGKYVIADIRIQVIVLEV